MRQSRIQHATMQAPFAHVNFRMSFCDAISSFHPTDRTNFRTEDGFCHENVCILHDIFNSCGEVGISLRLGNVFYKC